MAWGDPLGPNDLDLARGHREGGGGGGGNNIGDGIGGGGGGNGKHPARLMQITNANVHAMTPAERRRLTLFSYAVR